MMLKEKKKRRRKRAKEEKETKKAIQSRWIVSLSKGKKNITRNMKAKKKKGSVDQPGESELMFSGSNVIGAEHCCAACCLLCLSTKNYTSILRVDVDTHKRTRIPQPSQLPFETVGDTAMSLLLVVIAVVVMDKRTKKKVFLLLFVIRSRRSIYLFLLLSSLLDILCSTQSNCKEKKGFFRSFHASLLVPDTIRPHRGAWMSHLKSHKAQNTNT